MSNSNPMRVFSRTVASAIENSPEVQAFLDGNPIVPSTWGDYATRAIDLDLAEPTPAAVTELFGGPELANLADPAIQFENDADYNDYRRRFLNAASARYAAPLRVEAWRLEQTAQLIVSQWQVTDPIVAMAEVGRLNELIPYMDDETACAINCMRRDGLETGYEVTLADYTDQMLRTNVVDDVEPRELTRAWVSGIVDVFDAVRDDYCYAGVADMSPADVWLSRAQMERHTTALRRAPEFIADQYARADWDRIEPVFLAPTTLSVIEGNEK